MKGDRIGQKGENGSGKSAFANLLCGLITEYQGDIYFNHINYRDCAPLSIRQHLCLISAAPQLFKGTVKDNKTLGDNRDIPLPLLAILEKKKIRLGDELLEHGSNLSGGEAKLVQLARGIYRDCEMYLIDEPLNYIDKEYTELILQVMKELLIGKSLIVISHDNRAFELCNVVYALSNGVFQ